MVEGCQLMANGSGDDKALTDCTTFFITTEAERLSVGLLTGFPQTQPIKTLFIHQHFWSVKENAGIV